MLPLESTIHHLLHHALHHVKDFSITLLDIQGLFLFWNPGAIQLDGYEPTEIVGKPITTLYPATEEKAKLGEYMLGTALKEGRVKNIGKRLRKDGSIYWASVVLNAIYDEAGKHIGYIRIARELRDGEVDG